MDSRTAGFNKVPGTIFLGPSRKQSARYNILCDCEGLGRWLGMSKSSRNRTIAHPIRKGKAVEMDSWTAGFNKVPGTIFLGPSRKQSARYNILRVFAGSLTRIGRDEMISR
jgi:hypothetical protein